jgi:hypothetical protein
VSSWGRTGCRPGGGWAPLPAGAGVGGCCWLAARRGRPRPLDVLRPRAESCDRSASERVGDLERVRERERTDGDGEGEEEE